MFFPLFQVCCLNIFIASVIVLKTLIENLLMSKAPSADLSSKQTMEYNETANLKNSIFN